VSQDVGSFLTGIIILGALFVLVRPGSQGPALITGVGGALTGLISAATGGGTWAGTAPPAKKKK
jgi:hypothetical protein